ncbi:MAG: hypothetical protein ACYCZQ_09070 [Burkholderiales bacterium]
MYRMMTLGLILLLGGCGADVVGAAATGAASKAQEIKQAQKTEDMVKQRLDQANKDEQKRLEEADKAANQ